mmetsp:Transcript_9378/g.12624  ORF Transcript_9378/g.12624 Transcript_9378/m.12624 type:complete len:80 (+) Transcript_9378:340-579(+)
MCGKESLNSDGILFAHHLFKVLVSCSRSTKGLKTIARSQYCQKGVKKNSKKFKIRIEREKGTHHKKEGLQLHQDNSQPS